MLTIVVCVKLVPDVAEVRIDPVHHTLMRQGVAGMLNPFDEFAVEEGIRIRETSGGEVVAISMGPPVAEKALQTCLAMGVDKAYLLTDDLLAGSDTLATAFALSKAISKLGFDLILCGHESTDSSTGHVGPELAEHLGVPQVTFADRIWVDEPNRRLVVRKETENGHRTIQCSIPAVVSVVKGINVPRSPCGLVDSSKVQYLDASFLECSSELLGADGSPTQVVRIEACRLRRPAGVVIDSKLPAAERLRIITSGGILAKGSTPPAFDNPEKAAEAAVDFILRCIGEE
ncbi:MAG: electron transfer flavoprotein subunit beta/FixA family protein [Spirochaetes bacterium]|nr:electron transfer flavoprotein subunit beta/FixA family protein [Chloroflexota bacterium]MCX7038188.1 electron transfer flavoprotein subunit beta/FixA family protein [Spirochaetota bacterium]